MAAHTLLNSSFIQRNRPAHNSYACAFLPACFCSYFILFPFPLPHRTPFPYPPCNTILTHSSRYSLDLNPPKVTPILFSPFSKLPAFVNHPCTHGLLTSLSLCSYIILLTVPLCLVSPNKIRTPQA